MKSRNRQVQKSNSGAIADVSFLLLIFFMVVTTFNKDYKLNMTLPPYSDQIVSGPISGDRLIQLLINANNEIMMEDLIVGEDFAEQLAFQIERIIKLKMKPVIQVKIHPDTNYQAYIELLASINAAKNNLRSSLANQIFSQSYVALSRVQQDEIESILNIRVSEKEIVL